MRRLAYPLATLAVVLTVLGATVITWMEWKGPGDLVFGILFALVGVTSAVTGGVVATRVPTNSVGWLILGIGLGIGLLLATNAYADLTTLSALTFLSGQVAAAWVSSGLDIPVFYGLTGFLLLLFPTGRSLSPRWRVASWLFGVVVSAASLSHALTSAEIGPGINNPLALHGTPGHMTQAVASVTDVLALPAMIMCAVCLVARLRRSRGVERQQLKWFTYSAAVTGLGLGVTVLGHGILFDLAFMLGMVGLVLLPLTAGLAILRYRLYEIDVVIKRTLVYGGLTAVLVATYLVSVIAFRVVLDPITGKSDLAVAVSTLAVAALFRPLRSRIQAAVDRRFYRQHYDAEHTLEDFSGRLRDEIDLDSLGTELRSVVHDTMQPAHVSLWLRSEP